MRHRRNAETGKGRVKPLAGVFEGLLRLRVGNHRNDTRQNTAVAPGHTLWCYRRAEALRIIAQFRLTRFRLKFSQNLPPVFNPLPPNLSGIPKPAGYLGSG